MKTLVIGLDCAAPEIVMNHPRLPTFRRLMANGCYGRLESVVPPITVPAWMCMATSQDPGSLGIYGFRNRTGYSYDALGVVNAASITAPAIWDYIESTGGRAVVVGVPPGYPPRRLRGASVGCFLTPDTRRSEYTHPASLKQEIERLVGEYPVDVRDFRTDNKQWLEDEIYEMTRKHFVVVRHLIQSMEWDYFQFVEIGLDRIHHGFWKFHDPAHRQHVPDSPFRRTIEDYYEYLDEEIARTLECLEEETTVLVVSDHGAQRLDGGFCVNEWLYREGLLALHEYPSAPTPIGKLKVDWSRTKVWSEGGYYARVFFNVQGREPNGVVRADEYEDFLAEMRVRLQGIRDDRGEVMGTRVFRPRDVYREVRNVAPDLIAHFGNLYWRSIGGVGYESLHQQENDTGPDDCNHAQFGTFILSGSAVPLRGEIADAHLLDIAPTLLDVSGRPVPSSMQGRSLLAKEVRV